VDKKGCFSICGGSSCVLGEEPVKPVNTCPLIPCLETPLAKCPKGTHDEFMFNSLTGCGEDCQPVCVPNDDSYKEPDACKLRPQIACSLSPFPAPSCPFGTDRNRIVDRDDGCFQFGCGSGPCTSADGGQKVPGPCTVNFEDCATSFPFGDVKCPKGTEDVYEVDSRGCTTCRNTCRLTGSLPKAPPSCDKKKCTTVRLNTNCPAGSKFTITFDPDTNCTTCGQCVTGKFAAVQARADGLSDIADSVPAWGWAIIGVLAILLALAGVAFVVVKLRERKHKVAFDALKGEQTTAGSLHGRSSRRINGVRRSQPKVSSGSRYAVRA